MSRSESEKHDPYRSAIAALLQLRPKGQLTVIQSAAHLADRLAEWDAHAHGDWKDALAVEARRQGLHSRDEHVLLARVLCDNSLKRAHEIGKLIQNMGERKGEQYAAAIARQGGLKEAVKGEARPLRRVTIRRKPKTAKS